jgi:hypothetical protein
MGQDIFDAEINSDVKFYMVSKEVNNPANNYAQITKEVV